MSGVERIPIEVTEVEWAEPAWQLGHVVRDELGDVYAWTGIEGRPWVLLEHHHADTEHLVGAPSPDGWLWRPVEVIGEPVQRTGEKS